MQKKESKELGGKILAFLKRNIYYVLMIVCVLAITAIVTTVSIVNSGEKDLGVDADPPPTVKPDDEENPPVVEPKFMVTMPVIGGVMDKAFSDTTLVFDSTLGKYAVHLGVDLNGEVGSDIIAGFGGTVKSVDTDSYYGSTVVIEHSQGYTSVFRLVDEVSVKEGDKVTENTVIGKISDKFLYECKAEPHLHYEIMKDGENVDPMMYIADSDK